MCKETPCQTEVVIPHRSDLHWGILISQLFQGSHRVQTVMDVFPDLCIVKNRQSLDKFVKWKTFYVKMKRGLKYFWKSNHFSLSVLILEYKFWDKERKFINYLNVRFYFCLSLTRKSILKVLDEHLCNFFFQNFCLSKQKTWNILVTVLYSWDFIYRYQIVEMKPDFLVECALHSRVHSQSQ